MAQEPNMWSTYRRLMTYLNGYRLGFVISVIGMIGYSAVDSLFVYLLKPLIDDGFSKSNSEVLKWAPLFVIGLMFVRGLCSFLSTYGLAWVGTNVVMTLRQQLFSKFVSLPVSFYDQNTTGHLISMVTYNTEQVLRASTKALVTVVQQGALVIGLVGMMFWNSWQLSLVFLIIGPIIAFCVTRVTKRFRKVSKQIQDAMGNVTSATEQMVHGHKVVLSYNGQDVERARFHKINNNNRRQLMKLRTTQALSTPLIQVIASFALAGVLLVASMENMLDSLTPGTFTAIATSMLFLLRPIKQLTSVQGDFQRGVTAANSIFEVLDQDGEQDNGHLPLQRAQGELRLEHVTFTYPTKDTPALKDVSLHVPAGQTVALVGRSGSGKSTIASLLNRFYLPDEGEMFLDGQPLQEYKLADLRRQFAVVSQNVILFNDTVANNIAYGAVGEVSREQVEQALVTANAMEFIEKLPQGLDTEIGQNGVMLSGGQRQRLAIARALLRDSPILILDEATSALDTESERSIQKALELLQKDRTALVIAHRLSTIENADKIVVIEDGQVIEQGSHHELLAKEGAYAQLHKLQFNA